MTLPHSNSLLCDVNSLGVATLTLNRTEKNNAFDTQMIHDLIEQLSLLSANPNVRCLVLRANGEHFSAGADLQWMQSMAAQSHSANIRDAEQLAKLMSTLDNFPHPSIAVVQGCAFGGALGLICCCDIAIANNDAQLCLSEVKLGLIPATIGPYVCRAIGVRQARRYMLTAERIDAVTAKQLGLLHLVVEPSALDLQTQLLVQSLLANSPKAQTLAKQLCKRCDESSIDPALIQYTSDLIADIRVSPQGQEGLTAYFERRAPNWVQPVNEVTDAASSENELDSDNGKESKDE